MRSRDRDREPTSKKVMRKVFTCEKFLLAVTYTNFLTIVPDQNEKEKFMVLTKRDNKITCVLTGGARNFVKSKSDGGDFRTPGL